MRLKSTCLLTAWLPGFEPDDAANDAGGLLIPSAPLAAVAKEVKKAWPLLPLDLFDSLSGNLVEKYLANIEAIQEVASTNPKRDALLRYTGWGGLPQAFNKAHKDPAWSKRAMELESLLSKQEYQSAFDSTPNAHYTSPEIIAALWRLVERIGFKGGRVLEPSCGTGLFAGYMPTDMVKASTVTMVELDVISSKITSSLYEPFGAKVINSGFENVRLPANHFDLAISNVPFGNYRVGETRTVPYKNFLIHDYFIAKSLEVVREGGLVVVITSSGTMDKSESKVRHYLHTKAKLVGAIRLPSMAFKGMANTEVTTDVLVFQKTSSAGGEFSWEKTISVKKELLCDTWYPVEANQYFNDHPERVIGKFTQASNGRKPVLSCRFDGTMKEMIDRLDQAIATFPCVYQHQPKKATDTTSSATSAIQLVKGHFRCGLSVINGDVYESDGEQATLLNLPEKTKARVQHMVEIRDLARRLIAVQMETEDERTLMMHRISLEMAYDKFVCDFGYLNTNANKSAFERDPDLPLLLSLEHWNDEICVAQKSDIFHKRTIGVHRKVESCASVEDALTVSIGERGYVHPVRIAELVKSTPQAVMQDLHEKGLVYFNPDDDQWETADEYLSGNVRQKLLAAQLCGATSNIKALEAVIPTDLVFSEIGVRIGSTWIPTDDYEQFLIDILGCYPGSTHVGFNATAGAWSVVGRGDRVSTTQTWGTSRCDAVSLVEQALNQQVPTVTDPDPKDSEKRVINQQETIAAREKQDNLKTKFVEWLWSDDKRKERLVKFYNETMNCMVRRRYDGSHLSLPGYSQYLKLRIHQLNAIWRCIVSKSNVLLAHEVGAGKTLTMICAGMELRRLGKITKPLYVVPNHMLYQFATEFIQAYPGARVLCASKEDLQGDRRRTLISRIRTNDWDAVIVTHETFGRIPLSDSYLKQYIRAEVQQITDAIHAESSGGNSKIVKELAKARKMWQAKLDKLAQVTKKDDGLVFEELGIDHVFVDEAHLFKNLWRFTKMDRIAGLPNSNSGRAFDMFVKCRYINQKRPASVVFATATFVSNSMAELWVMQRFLQEPTLQGHHIGHFDAWAANFGEAVTALELSPDGSTYRMNTRFARFINLPELLGMFSEVADIQTKEMLNLPTPKARRETITAPSTDEVKAFVSTLVQRAEAIRNGRVSPKVDNMLAVTTAGRKAALNLLLCLPTASDAPESKTNLCVQKVYEIWKATASNKGAQLIFSDLGTPKSNGQFSVYEDMRAKLIGMGIPVDQIEFIHDHKTDATKGKLFKAVREGRVRVLFGSTQKMGVGTNVQTRLVALHHLDAPWRPADVIQREGRIERQGNLNDEIDIYRYVTQGSFDAYIWQTLETKARFIAQVLSGDFSVRSVEDVELAALSYAEVKALASGNPLVLEKAGVDAELTKLSVLKSHWHKLQQANRREIAILPTQITKAQEVIDRIRMDVAERKKLTNPLYIKLNDGKICTTPAQGQKALKAAMSFNVSEMRVAQVGKFTVLLSRGDLLMNGGTNWNLHLVGASGHHYHLKTFDKQCSFVNVIEEGLNTIGSAMDTYALHVQDWEKRLAQIKLEVLKPFDKEDRLHALIQRQLEIEALFETAKNVQGAVEEAPESSSSCNEEAAQP
jgi:N12 class adenine-specific DNA methylase/predicted RNA methylase